MKKERQFRITLNGQEKVLTLTRNFWGNRITVTVEGESRTLTENGLQWLVKTDLPFSIDGVEFRAVCADGRLGLVQNDQFSTGQLYDPEAATPFWGWIFFLICAVCATFCGIVGTICGFLGAWKCMRAANQVMMRPAGRVLQCVSTVLIVWGVSLLSLLVL